MIRMKNWAAHKISAFRKMCIIIAFLMIYHSIATAQQPIVSVDSLALYKKATVLDEQLSTEDLEQFLARENISTTESQALWKFYSDRDFRYTWFDEDGLTEHAQSFWNRYKQYLTYSKDSTFYKRDLHFTVDSLLAEDAYISSPSNVLTELLMTHQFYTFIQHAYTGHIDPLNFQWHVPKKKVSALSMLHNLLSGTKDASDWLPVSRQYLQMRDKLIALQNQNGKAGDSPLVLPTNELIKPSDSSVLLIELKKKLFNLGYLMAVDTSKIYDEETVVAVLDFQQKHGLAADGIIGPNVINALNVTLQERIKQVMINMERMRWLPVQKSGTSVWVNIPEFKLHLYENMDEVFNMGIVVGRAANRTVIFSEEIQHVVFSPYWNLPQSIVRNEIIPEINRDPRYLKKNKMEITGTRNGLPIIRQKPGRRNALGKVKFIFPNSYNIYLHDTPAKQLFERSSRAFSHGCIRLEEPFELAKYLLQKSPFWTDHQIRSAMNLNQEKWVKLKEPIPVYIVYLTAWVDSSGQLNFRDDIYGHDKRMAKQLFEEQIN